jgi:CubicO group peptidase (beta-lactamase class C family)
MAIRACLRTFAAAAALVAASGRAADGEETPRDVSGALRPIRERHGVPGLVALRVAGDRVVACGADGVRRRGGEERICIDDPMHLGSCTKAMTATLCAILVADGKLRFDGSVAAAFGDVKDVDPGWNDATLEQLLRHSAGAPENLDAGGLWGRLWAHRGTPVEARRLLVEGVLRRPPVTKPGERFAYSNAGYAIAGAMAETSARTPWEDLLRRRVFEPLGMRSAGFGAPGRAGIVDAPRGHRADGTPVEPGPGADNPPAIGPAGTVHASLPDWAKFVSLHLRRGEGAPGALAKLPFDRLHGPTPGDEAAMGWMATERSWGGGRVLTHAGSNTMWYCVAWVAPKRSLAVLAATNQGGPAADRACDEACAALLRTE